MLTGQAPFNGDNVNTIMYQTLNAIPLPPNEINPAVPEMLNFILVKALAKSLEDRYQNAQDFADDLRACRDTLPRSAQKLNTTAGGEKKLPPPVSITGRVWVDDESFKSASHARLSQTFDSTEATLRLAALTNSAEEVAELSKTLKITRPNLDNTKSNTPKASPTKATPPANKPTPPLKSTAPPPRQAAPNQAPQQHNNLLIVFFVLLGLLGIAALVLS
jgi:serine/threonine-protein kinase